MLGAKIQLRPDDGVDVSLLFHAQVEGKLKCESGEGRKGSAGGGLEEQRRLPVSQSSPENPETC